jgi:hypothetical protein
VASHSCPNSCRSNVLLGVGLLPDHLILIHTSSAHPFIILLLLLL